MFKLLMTYLIAVMTAGGIANTEVVANEKYQAGKHYEVLANPVATSTDGTIEVREFFWYGCPHCYQMEPFVEKWLAAKPDYVELVRSPAAFNDVWEDHARAYYVMKYSGKEETMHHLFFDAVNADQRGMRKRDKILAFFAEHGVDEKTYDKLASSMKVNAEIATTNKIMASAQITGVPAFMVHGKYLVKSGKTRDEMMDIISFLASKEHAASQ